MRTLLNRLDIVLENKEVNTNMGSLFHGYLMSVIDSDYAEYLHYCDIRPFSSYLFYSRKYGKFVWRLQTLNQTAYDMIIKLLIESKKGSIYLTHKDMNISVTEYIEYETVTYSDLYMDDAQQSKMTFVTPTSFKSQGQYMIFPDIERIFMSVIRKVNQFSDELKLEDESVISDLIDASYIQNYQLRSSRFYLEKTRVNGFKGDITIRYKGAEAYQQMIQFILKVSEYTGIGIKTSLGMGGIQIG